MSLIKPFLYTFYSLFQYLNDMWSIDYDDIAVYKVVILRCHVKNKESLIISPNEVFGDIMVLASPPPPAAAAASARRPWRR